MTTTERRTNELANLLSEHRVVRVEMQAEHAVCVAREDLPAYGIKAGETFHLYASSYAGYAYIVREGVGGRECSCIGFSFKHTCKHCNAVNSIEVARYYARKGEAAGTLVLEPIMREDDVLAHVEDSIRSGEFESCLGCGQRVKHEGYCYKCA